VVLVRKVGVCAIVTWLCVARGVEGGEIVSTIVVVVFNNKLPFLDNNDFSASLELVLSVPLFSFESVG